MVCTAGDPEPAVAAIHPVADPKIRPLFDAPSIDSPSYRQFLEALGVAVYTTDAAGRIVLQRGRGRSLGTSPGDRRGMVRLVEALLARRSSDGTRGLPDGDRPQGGRSVRGYEGVAERPDGTRAAFVPYPTVVFDASGTLIGAINVLVDVTERRRAEDALHAATAVKDEFLGLVSHELRTPVTTIFGNARLLQSVQGLPARQADMVGDIAADAERLLSLVENLLLMTRAASQQRVELEPQSWGTPSAASSRSSGGTTRGGRSGSTSRPTR